jgi:hypothetical protein
MSKRGAALISVIAALALPALAAAKDSDHDGLPNSWEKGKTPQGLNLKKLGADPKHRDVYVELAYSKGSVTPADVQCSALNDLTAAYKSGPLQNPDGKRGITLHIDAGKHCGKHHNYDLGGGVNTFKVNNSGCVSPLDYANVLTGKRIPVFHVGGVVGNSQLCGAEGTAEAGGDFNVKINGGTDFFSYVVMHELGHVFGLDHGPFDGFSVMSGGSYRFNHPADPPVLDYTRYPIQALDETNLDENSGFSTGSSAGDQYISQFYAPQYCGASLYHDAQATGPVDWNCSGAPFWVPPYSQYIDNGAQQYDVNNDGVVGTVPAVKPEWPRLKLGLGRIGG